MFEDDFEGLWERAESAKGGKYISKLSPSQLKVLDEFSASLVGVMTEASIKSYRSYIAKAIVLPSQKLTNDQKSAVRKFRSWIQSRKA